MADATMFFGSSHEKEFHQVLDEVQEYISSKYAALISDKVEEQKEQLMSYINKYLMDSEITVKDYTADQLVEKLYIEMSEFSFLNMYLFRHDVEEININGWDDVKITYSNGDTTAAKEKFRSADHCIDVIRRLLHKSNMILDEAQPKVRGHLSNKIRITAMGRGIIDNERGAIVSIRIVNPQKLTKEDFVSKGTATDEILDFLSIALKYGISMCVTGATSSGKTTLMSWILDTIPYDKRIFTIENNVREFNLIKRDSNGNVLNNVVHTVTRYSDDPKQNIDQEDLLEASLTCNPDIICVSEMKSSEAFAAQEAGRTGHAVITTTHANSCEATYPRMVTLCKMKYDIDDKTLYNLVTEAFPIILFTRKLEDKSRKIMEIIECEIDENGKRIMRPLFRYKIHENRIVDGKVTISGRFEKINSISKGLQKRLLENGMPVSELCKFVGNEGAECQ